MQKKDGKDKRSAKFEGVLKKVAIGLSAGIVVLVFLGTVEIIDLLIAMRLGILMLAMAIAINGYNLYPRNKVSAILLYASSLVLVVWLASGMAMS